MVWILIVFLQGSFALGSFWRAVLWMVPYAFYFQDRNIDALLLASPLFQTISLLGVRKRIWVWPIVIIIDYVIHKLWREGGFESLMEALYNEPSVAWVFKWEWASAVSPFVDWIVTGVIDAAALAWLLTPVKRTAVDSLDDVSAS